MSYRIHFWHGMDAKNHRSKKAQALIDKLESMVAIVHEEDNVYYWLGTLDLFNEEYGGSFMVMNGRMICVTQHNNFGQR